MFGTTISTRRDWLRNSVVGLGVSAGSISGWAHHLAAATPRKPVKSLILLWLDGGPATIDLWDLKPGHANGGPFRETATTAPGLRISEHLPKLAALGKHLSVVRSISSREGDHDRAQHLLRTGYSPQGAIRFPAVGSLIARELADADSDLPSFVSVAPSGLATRLGGGFLGPRAAPFAVAGAAGDETVAVPNLSQNPGVSLQSQRDRAELLERLNDGFDDGRSAPVAEGSAGVRARIRLMAPTTATVFDLERESDSTRDNYGRGLFGQGCLLARRLVERNVPVVEVTLPGWDTHANNFDRVKGLSATLDRAFAALLADLKNRGLLDSTLVVCQGEFGRTPKINGSVGRDHWPASWSVALAGGGIPAGGVIGRTSDDGMMVEDGKATVPDLIATVSQILGVDPRKQNPSNVGRPIRIADPSAKLIEGLL